MNIQYILTVHDAGNIKRQSPYWQRFGVDPCYGWANALGGSMF